MVLLCKTWDLSSCLAITATDVILFGLPKELIYHDSDISHQKRIWGWERKAHSLMLPPGLGQDKENKPQRPTSKNTQSTPYPVNR